MTRCCLCLRPFKALLDLPYGPTCPQCLSEHLDHPTLDDAAALLCVPILEEE